MTIPIVLPRVDVPEEDNFLAAFGARFVTGSDFAASAIYADLSPGSDVAIDIETPSVTDSFTIKCVTAAWIDTYNQATTVLLDPLRRESDAAALRYLLDHAGSLILHNSPFDVPSLVANGLMRRDQIDKVFDTLIIARQAWPDTMVRKSLEKCAERVLGMTEMVGALKLAQKASGLTSNEKWFREGDIHMPTYRTGAMADTLVTLRLAHPLFEAAITQQLDHPFRVYGCTTREQAGALLMEHQDANRTMLRRAARGLEVDLDYLDSYVDMVQIDRERANVTLKQAGLKPGVGAHLVARLDADGDLPARWPRTKPSKTRPEGTLKADKDTFEEFLSDHPLVAAHLEIAHTTKILGYMEKVAARSAVTGRLHPQFQILGASATGRMSVSEPELQQFPEEARPIILADKGSKGLQSIDWSSIEPALLAWIAKDEKFIAPFEAGEDLYAPIMEMARIPRKDAKVVLLGDMYGQGKIKLANSLKTDVDEAQEIKTRMRRAMPGCAAEMRRIMAVSDLHGMALTVSGRVLPIPRFNGVPASHKAVNYTIQGSGADLIYDVINNAEKAGIGDHILLPMHDEIVCSAEVAEEMQRIMATPPPRLIARAGRTPIIRTDSQFLGPNWRAC